MILVMTFIYAKMEVWLMDQLLMRPLKNYEMAGHSSSRASMSRCLPYSNVVFILSASIYSGYRSICGAGSINFIGIWVFPYVAIGIGLLCVTIWLS